MKTTIELEINEKLGSQELLAPGMDILRGATGFTLLAQMGTRLFEIPAHSLFEALLKLDKKED